MASVAPTPALGRAVWRIDPAHTLVEFSVRHLMVATVKGRFTGVRGTIVADAADPARSAVEVAIDAATIDTREARRDAHLRSADFLDAERHPTITFRSTRVEPLGRDRLRVVGALTIRGATREVALEATVNGRGADLSGAEVAGYTATATLDRTAFGLTWNVALETGGVLVGETVGVHIEVEAIRQG
jgi:polyisoprenoid-binding protein YceI